MQAYYPRTTLIPSSISMPASPVPCQDFEDKQYNVKAGKGYWQLGKLGPDLETEELQAKVCAGCRCGARLPVHVA